MPDDLQSTSWSSRTRPDGVLERVSARGTRVSPIAWKYLVATVLLPVAAIICFDTGGSRSDWRTLNGHSQLVESLTFSPDGQILASCSWDYTVRLWNVARRREGQDSEPVILPHTSTRFATAFSPDGSLLVSAGDRSLTIWSCRPEYKPVRELVGAQGGDHHAVLDRARLA